MRLGFVGPTYTEFSPNVDDQMCMNWFPSVVESSSAKGPLALMTTPGLSLFATISGGSPRGSLTINGRCFYVGTNPVNGANLFELSSAGVLSGIGSVAIDSNPASLCSDDRYLVVASGGNLYVYDTTGAGGAATLVPLDFAVFQVVYSDGYFVALKASSKQIYCSDLANPYSWPALRTAQVSVYPDNTLSMLCDHRELWLFGETKTAVYYNDGNPDFPFSPVASGYIETGINSPWSAVRADNSVFWLDKDERGGQVVRRANGYNPTRVSNHAVEQKIQRLLNNQDAVAYAYQENGHTFYVLYFRQADQTWVLDVESGFWHQRGFWDTNFAKYTAHRSWNHIYAFGKHLVGDWQGGGIFEMSTDFYTDAGTAIRRERRAPHVCNELKWLYHKQLWIDVDTGTGVQDSTAQGYDPQMILQASDDGGRSWGNEMSKSCGKAGATKTRVVYRRLGRSRDRVYRAVFSDPVPCTIADAYLEISA